MLTKSIFIAVLLTAPVALATGPAAAHSWKDESGNGKYEREYKYKEEYKRDRHGYKYKWQDGNCKYEYKQGKHGYKEKRKCKGGARFTGGPPPWAPAHGYRAHRHGGYRAPRHGGYQGSTQTAYVPPFDIGLGGCNRELLGSLLGAAAGGLAGSQIGDGRGQLAATAGGTLLGFLIGGSIGRSMDEIDQNCIGQALEHGEDGQQIAWNNPQTGAQYQVVPTRTVQVSDGRYCREYTATSVVGGRNQQTYGRACRQPDGSWKLVD